MQEGPLLLLALAAFERQHVLLDRESDFIGRKSGERHRDRVTPNFLPANTAIGEIDRNQTHSNSFGGSVQATETAQFFGHNNHFVVGTSPDHGDTNFRTSSELGTIDQNFFVNGTGVFID
jgi:iron complex outermembrane receptor protein